MLVNVIANNGNIRDSNRPNIFNITILIISSLSVVTDAFIGLALVIQYYINGKSTLAIFTFTFMFIPSIIIQILSIKLYFLNNDMKTVHWILHLVLLGFVHRYLATIKKHVNNFHSVNYFESNSVVRDMNNMRNLYLFKCFMECVPQLILQLFIIATSSHLLLTKLSISSSVLSLIWALVTHTNFKRGKYCNLVWLILWRTGTICARVAALVLCAYICGPWIILFMGSHWLAMVLWITYQKSAANENRKNGEFNSAIFGLIYCYCFFSLKLEQSKWQALTLNLLFFFENLIFLTVFLTRFSVSEPKLALASFLLVIFGNLLGISSLFMYYKFLNCMRTYKCMSPMEDILCGKKGILKEINASKGLPEEEQHRDAPSFSDSVIIIEENPASNSTEVEKLEISEEKVDNIYEDPAETEMGNTTTKLNLPIAIKRRAICSSVDLGRFVENRASDPEMESDAVVTDESPSEILSTRDYENICAVNIAREPWGMRSWRGYSDIETLRHDDSIVIDGRLDNLTTSSEYSGKFEDKDSFISDEKCDIDTTTEEANINVMSPSSSNILKAIVEEEVRENNLVNNGDKETKCNSKSTLVATIDKICFYTPLRTRSRSTSNYSGNTDSRTIFGKDIKNSEKIEKFPVKLHMTAEKQESFSPFKNRFRPVQKLNIFKERYETNRYQITSKSAVSMVEVDRTCTNNENSTNGNNKVSTENRIAKPFGFREKSLLLKQMLTPSIF